MKRFLKELDYALTDIMGVIGTIIMFVGSVFLLLTSVMFVAWMICHAKEIWLYIQGVPHLLK